MKTIARIATLSLLIAAGACSDDGTSGSDAADPAASVEKGSQLGNGKADQWAANDSPTLFSDDLEFRLSELPEEGEAVNIPWAGSYWPVWKDAVNDRWDGSESMSPAEKYGKAFGHENFEDTVSKHHGIDNADWRKECTSNSDCNNDEEKNKGKCAKRRGEESGRCIPTWWGLCHAWAPVAVLEPEAVNPVTRNGVEFKANDIKALMTLAYNRSTSKFLSLRCNENSSDIMLDEFGNPTGEHSQCKDTNAGTFHVIMTNYLGLKGESFVEDRTYDDEVWNQPVAAYRVTKMEEVTAAEANDLAGAYEQEAEVDTETREGEAKKGEWYSAGSFSIPKKATVKVVMEITEGDADLYTRFDKAPTSDEYDCRPFSSETEETCEIESSPEVRRLYVKAYAFEDAKVRITVEISTPESTIPDTYIWNDEAVTFFNVKTELDYITESPSTLDGNLADSISSYTKTDRYNYILEVDRDGKIIGGEWVGSSKKSHPDFLWLPTGRSHMSAAGGKLSYAVLKSMLDESIGGGSVDGTAIMTANESGAIARGEWKQFGPYEVASGDIEVTMSGDGDADLYLRKGEAPDENNHDCRPYLNGTSERCTTEGPASFYVAVYGYATTSNFELNITYAAESADSAETPTVAPATETSHIDESGSVTEGDMKYFTVDVRAGQTIVVRTEAENDIDLYIKMHQAPTTAAYDKRGYTATGNETVSYTANSDGTLHVMVHGYKASDFKVSSANE